MSFTHVSVDLPAFLGNMPNLFWNLNGLVGRVRSGTLLTVWTTLFVVLALAVIGWAVVVSSNCMVVKVLVTSCVLLGVTAAAITVASVLTLVGRAFSVVVTSGAVTNLVVGAWVIIGSTCTVVVGWIIFGFLPRLGWGDLLPIQPLTKQEIIILSIQYFFSLKKLSRKVFRPQNAEMIVL